MVNKKTVLKQQQKSGAKFNLSPLSAGVRLALTGMLAGTLSQPVQAELPVAASNWVGSGAATKSVVGNKLQINQATNKAVLNWQRFNIGASNHVNFSQPGSSSVALNRIAQNDPSRILGKLTANGQIYLINKNGFIFGKNSVINVNSLIASTHDISDDIFERGITRVFDDSKEAAFVLDPAVVAANQAELKKILIESGAKIKANDAGRIILVAPEVDNKGSLEVGEQGQIMLVASQDKVYLQQADSDDFAGLLVEVDTGGKVSNFGDMLAKQGNITMAGFVVNQAGRVNATTSVNLNGSIRLQAREGQIKDDNKLVGTKTTRSTDLNDGLGTEATLTFAEGSVTELSIDPTSGTAVDDQLQAKPQLDASAHTITLKAGSQVVAHGADLKFVATDNILSPNNGDSGLIDIEQGSVLDVSGIDAVNVGIARNVVKVDVRSFELRDSPNQRAGILNGEAVYVDIRNAGDIVDISGAKARIERSTQERLAVGGSISLTSSGDVKVANGALIDVSGGYVNYLSGDVATTQLINQAGVQVDIGNANVDDTFVSFSRPEQGTFQAGYQEGKDAGSLEISSAALDWQGTLDASVVNGRLQRTESSRATGGEFNIDLTVFEHVQNIAFQSGNAMAKLALSGIQDFSLKTLGDVSIAENTRLLFSPFSSFSVEGGSVAVNGEVYSAGGNINMTARFDDRFKNDLDHAGELILGQKALLDVSGRWVNDRQTAINGVNPSSALALDGGEVILTSSSDLTLQQGSVIKANGGAQYTFDRKIVAGKGGDISLIAEGISAAEPALLTLNGSVTAQALQNNGSLSLTGSNIVVDNFDFSDPESKTTFINSHNRIFSEFSNITLQAKLGDVRLTENAKLNLIQKNRVFKAGFNVAADNRSLNGFTSLQQNPEYLRSTTELNLIARNNVEMLQGSSIVTQAGSAINFTANNSILVDGSIFSPSGTVGLTIDAVDELYNPAQSIVLGEHANIALKGSVSLTPDRFLFRTGEVKKGGTLALLAERGFIRMEDGAIVDISGTSAILDIAVNGHPALGVSAQRIGSDAGQFKLTSAEGIFLDGQLKAQAGSATAKGGMLSMTLDRSLRQDPLDLLAKPELKMTVSQSIDEVVRGEAGLATDWLAGSGVTDLRLNTPDSIVFKGDVNLDMAQQIQLDSRSIGWQAIAGNESGTVNLNAPHLAIRHTLKDVGESTTNRQVEGLVEAGNAIFNAHAGSMELTGAVKMNGFSAVNLRSDNQIQVRGINNPTLHRDFVGEIVTAGHLTLQASQISPSTLSDFSFKVVNNPAGKISIIGNQGNKTIPLSAAGSLTLEAAHILQAGTLVAPLGKITLNATETLELSAGSVTSVSADGLIIPFGVTEAELDWLYPLNSVSNLVLNSAPDKQIVLSAKDIDLAEGSVVDLSAGGDLFAYEFVPGLGGSSDYLQAGSDSSRGGFAILPSLGSGVAPFDHFQSNNAEFANRETVYLDGSNGLAAGFYTKLPAHYALLPGAFLVTPVAGTQDQSSSLRTLDGRQIVSGFNAVAGTNIRDARSSGFLIENGAQVRKHSQYAESTGDAFFTKTAVANEKPMPLLAKDGGLISILAQTRLALNAQFKVGAAFGNGAKMDIASNRLDVVDTLSETPNADVLEILASDLSDLNIDSLLLGGGRNSRNADNETNISVVSEEVRIKSNSVLEVADIILAAKKQLVVEEGASIIAKGTVNTGDQTLVVQGDGALLRVSADEQVDINRVYTTNQPQGLVGDLTVANSAVLEAGESMLIDASHSSQVNGEIVMDGGSLNLAATEINLGDVEGLDSDGALNISNADLNKLTVDELVLTSRKSINLRGDVGRLQDDGSLGALSFQRLELNSMGLVGDVADQQASIQATELVLKNTQDEQTAANFINSLSATAAGTLDLNADKMSMGKGTFALAGFDKVNLTVNDQLIATDKGTLKVNADLNLAATTITATGKGDLHIDVSGHSASLGTTGLESVAGTQELTGAIAVTADDIALNTRVVLPSGQLKLHALTGDVELGNQAQVDLAGRQINFSDSVVVSKGGVLDINSELGNIAFETGSSVDLRGGASTVSGGQMKLSATEGTIGLSGEIKAENGSIEIDQARFNGSGGLNDLASKIATAGFNQSIRLRTRLDDMVLAQDHSINAQDVLLTADTGKIEVHGNIIATKKSGGIIELSAADKVILADGGVLRATGTEGKSGKVVLNSTDADLDNEHGIELNSGGLIDVASADGAKGEVVLRALRVDSDNNGTDDDIAIASINADIVGADRFHAEGVKIYTGDDLQISGQIRQADINKFKADTDQYMSLAIRQDVETRLGSSVHLRPGIEVQQQGDLSLNEKLDTVDWRYASIWDTAEKSFDPAVGQVVLRASGDLNINKTITDGYKLFFGMFDQLQSGQSWGVNLVAGADLNSANGQATQQNTGDINIASNVTIRTGTGDLNIVAGKDINFADVSSVVYSAGRATKINPYGSLTDSVIFTLPFFGGVPEFPIDGGDVSFVAGANINGIANDNQYTDDWLLRVSPLLFSGGETIPTIWGIKADGFKQNIGSFGGGTVNVVAGSDINDLSVMMPTTGKPVGETMPGSQGFVFEENKVEINGGGNMFVSARGNVNGGSFLSGKGEAEITALGSIQGSAANKNGPLLSMGDSQFKLVAGDDISITGVTDPMIADNGEDINFFTLSADSQLEVNSLSGNIFLGAKRDDFTGIDTKLANHELLANIYPATLNAKAAGGSITVGGDIVLFPSATGDLVLLAKDQITSTGGQKWVVLSDADSSLLPNELTPIANNEINQSNAANRLNPVGERQFVHAASPVHLDDRKPVTISTLEGDIGGINFNVAKHLELRAGNDVTNIQLVIQNTSITDSTLVAAGRDIRFPNLRGNSGGAINNASRIEVAGPGSTLVMAGRDVDLGRAIGISTVGDQINPALADVGADLTVMAGINSQLNFAGFLEHLRDIGEYDISEILTPVVNQQFVEDESFAFSSFDQLIDAINSSEFSWTEAQFTSMLIAPFYNELVVASKTNDIGRGFDAIEALAPGSNWDGDLSLFFSKVHTIDGGDVNLFVPGGNINAGLSVTGGNAKDATELGIVAQQQGSINAFLDGNFSVNQSRVFALGGSDAERQSDILIWSSNGNIDAGRGAKSALTVPPPIVFFDEEGNLQVIFPPVVSGSGIRTAASGDREAGNVILTAPNGVIDAGEAGIGGNNVTLVAPQILNGGEIDVGGVGSGVPAATASAAPVSGLSNSTASISKAAENSAQNNSSDSDEEQLALGMLSVDVVGFGSDEDQAECKSKSKLAKGDCVG